MSVALSITVLDPASPALRAKLAALRPEVLALKAAEPMRRAWRDALAALPSNRKGFPSQGYWEQASRSVQEPEVNGGTVTLTANKQGLRLRWLGGTIKPVKGRFLAFGITEASYGKTPTMMGYVPGDTVGNRKLKGLFAFARSVTQRANPAVVPTEAITAAAVRKLERSLA